VSDRSKVSLTSLVGLIEKRGLHKGNSLDAGP